MGRAVVEPEDNPFWTFSLELYARPGVAPACLALQERHGLDVNLLLFCCWAGTRGRSLGRAELDRLIETSRPWHEAAVRPLRGLRRWLKSQDSVPAELAESLRARVKADELAAEALEQWLLARALPVADGAGAPGAVAANLGAYVAALGRAPGPDDVADLAVLLGGCCPELQPLEAVRLLGG